MKKLECPRCKSENIENDDIFDISSTPFDTTDHVCAHCLNCGANIVYDRVYNFVGYENIELVED